MMNFIDEIKMLKNIFCYPKEHIFFFTSRVEREASEEIEENMI